MMIMQQCSTSLSKTKMTLLTSGRSTQRWLCSCCLDNSLPGRQSLGNYLADLRNLWRGRGWISTRTVGGEMAMNKIQAPPALMLWQTISSPPDSILLLCLEEVRAAATIVSELRRVGPVASLAANLNTKNTHLRNIIDLIIGPFQRGIFPNT